MRKELYRDLIASLKGIKDEGGKQLIKHIDLWNQNVAFISEDESWPMPAVFIEFGQFDWHPLKGSVLRYTGGGTVMLHIVTEWQGSSADGSSDMERNIDCWSLADKIHKVLEGGAGESYHGLQLLQTLTNHNHEDIVENIETYKVVVTKTLRNYI